MSEEKSKTGRWHMPDWKTNQAGKFFRGIGPALDRWRKRRDAAVSHAMPADPRERSRLEQAARQTIFNPPAGTEITPGPTETPLGTTTTPAGPTPGKPAAQPSQTPGNRYLEMAKYGPPLIDAATQPATEADKKRFFDMGGIQTIRGTMKPDERPSVGWWNPNTLREHATIQEGMMGQDLGTTMERYKVDAPIRGKLQAAGISAAGDIAAAREKARGEVVKVMDPLTGEERLIRVADIPRRPPQSDLDHARVISQMAPEERDDYARKNNITRKALQAALEWLSRWE